MGEGKMVMFGGVDDIELNTRTNRVFGGYDGEEVFGDAWQLDLSTLQWSRLRMELPLPVYFHTMTVSAEGKMVMFGGVDDIELNTRTNRVFSAWLKVPSLRSMAWEAVCHYKPGISSVPPTMLLEEGVPKDCVEMFQQHIQPSSLGVGCPCRVREKLYL